MSREAKNIIQILNPADHFTLAMDEEIRKEGMAGSLCGFALELDAAPDVDLLGERIARFCRNFPVATANLKKIGRRFHWCARDRPGTILFLHELSGEQNEADEIHIRIQHLINQTESRECANPLEFHLLRGVRKAVFLIRWVHPFCDAVGAGLILQYLTSEHPPPESELNVPSVSLVNEKLSRYSVWQKLILLLKAKKLIEQIDQSSSILPKSEISAPQYLNFRIFRLSLEQSQKIAEISRKKVGLTGISLYYIACLMRAIERLESRSPGEAFCVPYAFNLRKQKAKGPVTGNHVSALFAQAPIEIVRDRERLFAHLTRQYRQAIREQLDFAFLPLMWAAQWMSLDRYGKTLRRSYRDGRERSSFWFSDIGRSDLAGRDLFGAQITGVFHLAQVTTPPGLALLTGIFEERLSLSYNFVEPLYDPDWILRLHRQVLFELLGEHE